MKLNVTLELDWIEEDGSLDDELKNQLVNKVIMAIQTRCVKDIESKANKAFGEAMLKAINILEETISKKTNTFVNNWLSKPIKVTDEWGDPKEECTVEELVKKRFDNLLSQKVDENGKPTRYSSVGTLHEFIVGKKVSASVNKQIGALAGDIDKKIKEAIDANLKDKIGAKFAELVLTTAKN